MAENQISKLSVLLMLNTEAFETSLEDTQKLLRKTGRIVGSVGKQLSIGLSLPLALAGKRITETATEFEYQMARVSAISGAGVNAFKNLQTNAEELGASTIYTAREVGQLQEEYAKLGFGASQITAVTQSTLSLAQVTGSDLARAAEIAGSTLRIFGLDASKVAQVNDVVAVAISRSGLDFEAFAETMKYAGSDAAIAGVSLEELAAAMGVLANRGVKGSIAGTRLRMIFAKLAKEGGDVHQKFLDVVNGTMSMQEAIERFGVRAASAIPVLQANKAEFLELKNAMQNSSGALDLMQEKMDDTAFAAQKTLKSALENLSIQLGKVLLPIVTFLARQITAITNGFASMPGALKVVVVVMGSLAVIIPPLLFLLGQMKLMFVDLTMFAPRMAAAMSTILGPWGLVAAAVIGVTAAIAGYLMEGDDLLTLQERIADANGEAADEMAKTVTPIKKLIGEYENANTTQERRLTILRKLNELQPDYFSALKTEETAVADLWAQYDRLTVSLLAVAKARAIQKQMTKISEEQAAAIGEQVKAQLELADIEKRAAAGEKGYAPYTQAKTVGAGGVMIGTGGYETIDPKAIRKRELNRILDEQQQVFDDLQAQYEALQSMFDDLGIDLSALLKGSGAGGGGGAGGAGEESQVVKTMNALAEALFMAENAALRGGDAYDVSKQKAQAYQKAIDGLVKASFAGEDVSQYLTEVVEGFAKFSNEVKADEKAQKVTEAIGKMTEGMDAASNSLELGLIDQGKFLEIQMSAIKSALDTLLPVLGAQDEMVQALAKSYAILVGQVKAYAEGQDEEAEKQKKRNGNMQAGAQILYDFGSSMATAGAESETFGERVKKSFSQAFKAAVRMAYASWLKTLFADEKTPALGKLALGAVGFGVLDGLVSSIPALKNGGITMGPQLALVGDNRSGREAIIPLEKLPSLMQKMGGGGSGRLYSTIDGRDIVLSTERTNRMNQRTSR